MTFANQLVQILYWLSLSTWFGGTLFIAIAAPIIFRTIRDADPTLPKVLSVNLEGQHGTLLAGTIVSNILQVLTRVQLACAAGLLLAVILQWVLVMRAGGDWVLLLVRSLLLLAAIGLVLTQWLYLWPRIGRYRQEYLDNADNPEVANPAKDQFDRHHHDSVNVLLFQLFLLLGMIFFTPAVIHVVL